MMWYFVLGDFRTSPNRPPTSKVLRHFEDEEEAWEFYEWMKGFSLLPVDERLELWDEEPQILEYPIPELVYDLSAVFLVKGRELEYQEGKW